MNCRKPSGTASFVTALSLSVCALAGCGGPPAPSDGWREGAHRWFDAEAVAGLDETGHPTAALAVSIPYRNLVFFQEEGSYVARYVLRVEQGATRPAIEADEWNGEVVVATFAETRESRVERKTVRLDLRPELAVHGPIPVEVAVIVAGTQRRGSVNLELSLGDVEPGGVTLGDLTFYRLRNPLRPLAVDVIEVPPGGMPDVERFLHKADSVYDRVTGSPWLLLRVFDLSGDTTQAYHAVTLAVEAMEDTEEFWSRSVELRRRGVESSMLVPIPGEALPFGRSQLRVSMAGAVSRRVLLDNRGLDLADDRSWEANLAQLEDLASEQEMATLRQAPSELREQRWMEFWARRDPDPLNPDYSRLAEHHRRVAHARVRLVDGFSDGARSDRGRIYVLHGEPDDTETTSPYPDVPETYEVWRYFELGLAYSFRQDVGGSFRLAGREQI